MASFTERGNQGVRELCKVGNKSYKIRAQADDTPQVSQSPWFLGVMDILNILWVRPYSAFVRKKVEHKSLPLPEVTLFKFMMRGVFRCGYLQCA